MPEVAFAAGHDHGDAGFVGGGHHLVVPDRPAGLHHGGHPGVGQHQRPSGKGKKASLAAAPPRARSAALATAISAATTRDCWPAPTPTAWLSVTTAMALDVVRAHTFQAMARSRHCVSVGRAVVADLPVGGLDQEPVGVLDQHAGPRAPGAGAPAARGTGPESSRVALRFEASRDRAASS